MFTHKQKYSMLLTCWNYDTDYYFINRNTSKIIISSIKLFHDYYTIIQTHSMYTSKGAHQRSCQIQPPYYSSIKYPGRYLEMWFTTTEMCTQLCVRTRYMHTCVRPCTQVIGFVIRSGSGVIRYAYYTMTYS